MNMTKIIIMILMIVSIINNHDRDPNYNYHDSLESSCDPKPHQLRTKREGAHKVHIPPNHGDCDHVDDDNNHQ